mgnify:CR=1 FL=1
MSRIKEFYFEEINNEEFCDDFIDDEYFFRKWEDEEIDRYYKEIEQDLYNAELPRFMHPKL